MIRKLMSTNKLENMIIEHVSKRKKPGIVLYPRLLVFIRF